jgi:hypothetical protein
MPRRRGRAVFARPHLSGPGPPAGVGLAAAPDAARENSSHAAHCRRPGHAPSESAAGSGERVGGRLVGEGFGGIARMHARERVRARARARAPVRLTHSPKKKAA